MKIAINGFGRIGRIFFRQAFKEPSFEIVAINDLGKKENLFYLLRYDSVYGRFEISDEELEKIHFFGEKDPSKLPWKDLGIDVVVESTGVFTSYEKSKPHLEAGAKRVVITAPVPPDDNLVPTCTPNLMKKKLTSSQITSNASCTTNATVPVAAVMMEEPGVLKATLTTIHSYTSTQSLIDGPSKKDYRRGRAGAINIIPSHTGAAIATSKVIPALKDKFDGLAVRVPSISGSLIDFTFLAKRKTSVEEINDIFKKAATKPEWQGILKIAEGPLVSTDILGEPYGSIVDLDFTRVIDGDLVKVFSWYDNEWGYCAMLLKHIKELEEFL